MGRRFDDNRDASEAEIIGLNSSSIDRLNTPEKGHNVGEDERGNEEPEGPNWSIEPSADLLALLPPEEKEGFAKEYARLRAEVEEAASRVMSSDDIDLSQVQRIFIDVVNNRSQFIIVEVFMDITSIERAEAGIAEIILAIRNHAFMAARAVNVNGMYNIQDVTRSPRTPQGPETTES